MSLTLTTCTFNSKYLGLKTPRSGVTAHLAREKKLIKSFHPAVHCSTHHLWHTPPIAKRLRIATRPHTTAHPPSAPCSPTQKQLPGAGGVFSIFWRVALGRNPSETNIFGRAGATDSRSHPANWPASLVGSHTPACNNTPAYSSTPTYNNTPACSSASTQTKIASGSCRGVFI